MTPAEISQAAQALFVAEKSQKQIGLLTRAHPEMTMDDAYAVQKALVALKIADGRRVTGWKIGLTSKAMQYALNIDIPDSGILFDDMHFEDGVDRASRAVYSAAHRSRNCLCDESGFKRRRAPR